MVQRRIVLAAAVAASLGACSTAPVRAAAGQLVDVQLIDRARHRPLAEYRHRGLTWVAGRPGERYAVRLVNRSGARVLVVLSVDGVNAVSGETAHTAQTGYVLAPGQSADITGWRKSDSEAAAFYFTALPDSYAARTERPQHVGVIGAAVFRERGPRPAVIEPAPFPSGRQDGATTRQEGERRANDAGTDSRRAEGAAAAPLRERPADKLGTGHGEREHAPVHRTAFERATAQPAEIVQVRYDSHANLVASGVIAPAWRGQPDPFPGFVPDPPP